MRSELPVGLARQAAIALRERALVRRDQAPGRSIWRPYSRIARLLSLRSTRTTRSFPGVRRLRSCLVTPARRLGQRCRRAGRQLRRGARRRPSLTHGKARAISMSIALPNARARMAPWWMWTFRLCRCRWKAARPAWSPSTMMSVRSSGKENTMRPSCKIALWPLLPWIRTSKVASWNPGAEQLFGYTMEEAIGQNVDEMVAATAEIRSEAE